MMRSFFALATLAASLALPPTTQADWRGGFGEGDFSQWTTIHQGPDGDCCTVVPFLGRPSVAKLEVEPGDSFAGTWGERAELVKTGLGMSQGATQEISWQVFFPSSYNPSPGTEYGNIFTQFHQSWNNCPPTISFQVGTSDEHFYASLRKAATLEDAKNCILQTKIIDLGQMSRGRWFTFRMYVTWDWEAPSHITLLLDGEMVFDLDRPTLYPEMSVYLKQGLYRAPSLEADYVLLDNTRVQ